MKAEVITRGEKEHAVVLGKHEVGTSKLRSDADFHANVLNRALAKVRLDEAYEFRSHFHAQGPFDMPFGQLKEIVGWMDERVSELEKEAQ